MRLPALPFWLAPVLSIVALVVSTLTLRSVLRQRDAAEQLAFSDHVVATSPAVVSFHMREGDAGWQRWTVEGAHMACPVGWQPLCGACARWCGRWGVLAFLGPVWGGSCLEDVTGGGAFGVYENADVGNLACRSPTPWSLIER